MKKVTLFCAAALFSLLSFAQNDKGDIVKTGDKMPAFTLTSTVNGTVNSADPKREVTNKFASQYIPRSYLINKEGKVISATVGYQKEEMDKLMKEIDKALK